ncbi:MarR family winged helix-turn-helix transcriptional regulator [Pseudoxanthomonas wuyuanensis]|uniref:Transcriptional regulator n=1 Tax=Pseudoxanthomonas wuyuanensis TaxID=1073196 RepID=A0A286D6C6_9GAMM|nr:MarR family winged helix-turn-helix transcriptional regulator [Pseudoxanthomonas wuyuanensis]KAF1721532.1 MarR family transcriptional regulator [Pseudoxanthomonas wuyuanensis]SOD54164.1 transcriptional regulator [Pseudoxanthomonas wuyuanensis]
MFDRCLYFNTAALSRMLERVWTQAFSPFGLSPPQAFLLRAVLAQPGQLQRELAHALTITRPTATRLLDGLQQRGLIERRNSDHDGRELEIHPTAAALAIASDLNRASATVTRRLQKTLGEQRFGDVVAQMRQVREMLG